MLRKKKRKEKNFSGFQKAAVPPLVCGCDQRAGSGSAAPRACLAKHRWGSTSPKRQLRFAAQLLLLAHSRSRKRGTPREPAKQKPTSSPRLLPAILPTAVQGGEGIFPKLFFPRGPLTPVDDIHSFLMAPSKPHLDEQIQQETEKDHEEENAD